MYSFKRGPVSPRPIEHRQHVDSSVSSCEFAAGDAAGGRLPSRSRSNSGRAWLHGADRRSRRGRARAANRLAAHERPPSPCRLRAWRKPGSRQRPQWNLVRQVTHIYKTIVRFDGFCLPRRLVAARRTRTWPILSRSGSHPRAPRSAERRHRPAMPRARPAVPPTKTMPTRGQRDKHRDTRGAYAGGADQAQAEPCERRFARLSPFCAGAAAGRGRSESGSCVLPGRRQAAIFTASWPACRMSWPGALCDRSQ
jgi:hypothetical protein